jgi:hypothetical protein
VSLHRRAAQILAVAAIAGASFLATSPAHADEALPFKDPNAVGLIGFCDANNKPVTSGHVRDVPFAVKAVSNTPAGKAYAVTGRKAALYATSPNKELDPSLWSPYQMTPSTFYSNAKHPMAAAGFGEPPLEYHITGAPPTLDNLVQLRMYLSAPNTTPYIQKYPTAVIRVEGDRWVMVTGDRSPDCTAGTAKNINQVLGKGEPTAPPTWAANAAAATKPGASAGAPSASASGTDASGAGGEPTASGGAGGGDSEVSASSRSSSAPHVLPIALGLLLATAAVAVVVVALASRRKPAVRASGSHSNGG